MGYLISRYRKLFPQGTFDAPKQITTWSESHRLFAQNQVREKDASQILAPGLIFKKGHIDFPDGGFSNYECWEIDPRKRKLQVVFYNDGEFPVKAFVKTANLRILATLGYFYFTTNPEADKIAPPMIKVNNLFIRRGQLLQLPVADRAAFIIFKNGKVEIPFIQACGNLEIGGKKFRWCGARTKKVKADDTLTVYTGSAGVIEPYEDLIMGPGRLAKKAVTPGGNSLDLIITLKGKNLQVGQIRDGGTEVTQGLMILNGSKNLLKGVKKGEVLSGITTDNLKVADIFDAVSVGPRIFKEKIEREKQLVREGLDDDKSLCNQPHREGLKLARAFLVKLKDGRLASVLIDGIPQAGAIYPGVTPQEAADFLLQKYPDAQEIVATDPGGTMKAVYRNKNGKTQVFGNLHYLNYRYNKDGTLDFWPNGWLGRKAVTFLGVF